MSGSKSGSLKSADEKIATVGAVNTGWDYSHGFGGQLKGENNGKTTVTATYYDWNDNSEKKYDFYVIVGDAGVITKNGWVSEDGGPKYYKDGKPYTGWHYMEATEGEKTPHWSYFGGDGKIYTGWRKMGRNDRTENRYRVPIKI